MIIAKFCFGENGSAAGFTVSGHSGSAPAGEDIVCAAVSSAAYMAVNTVTEVLGLTPEIRECDGFLSMRLSEAQAETALPILKGLCLHIEGLSEQYPEFIQLERGAL